MIIAIYFLIGAVYSASVIFINTFLNKNKNKEYYVGTALIGIPFWPIVLLTSLEKGSKLRELVCKS